ncbi:hypothetical protein IVA95_21415 [Bradyrhizobium sp. 157]|nr:hypothetical protein [Bradyrhizobium sp. 157]
MGNRSQPPFHAAEIFVVVPASNQGDDGGRRKWPNRIIDLGVRTAGKVGQDWRNRGRADRQQNEIETQHQSNIDSQTLHVSRMRGQRLRSKLDEFTDCRFGVSGDLVMISRENNDDEDAEQERRNLRSGDLLNDRDILRPFAQG